MMSKRKIKNRLIPVLFFCWMILLNACQSTTRIPTVPTANNRKEDEVSLNGTIQKQVMTTYQYGTHVLQNKDGKTLYALKSEMLRLDDYIGKTVEVRGQLLNEYPIEGGPPYVEVVKINE
jgi:hypothetical protein